MNLEVSIFRARRVRSLAAVGPWYRSGSALSCANGAASGGTLRPSDVRIWDSLCPYAEVGGAAWGLCMVHSSTFRLAPRGE